MFYKIGNSWQLVKASWAVLRSDKELLIFPVVSMITMIIISIVFLLPVSAILGLLGAGSRNQTTSDIIGYAILFLFYLVSYTISIFFNVALVGAAMIRLDGGDPTVSDGLRIARSKFGIIFQYALISATVGMILRIFERRLGVLGGIISWLGGLIWNIATFLVVPILAVKDIGPIDAVKESTRLLKQTWGEQLIANEGMGFVFGLFGFLVVLIGGFLAVAVGGATESAGLVFLIIALTIIVVIGLGVVAGALGGIFQAALYRYAETGAIPSDFDIDLIKGAFTEKNKRG